MATLDTSIVNIALPQIAREYHSTLSQISWVMVIYLLVNLSLLLTSGRLGDLLAPGRLYLLGLLIFTGASALCGVSARPGLAGGGPGPARAGGVPDVGVGPQNHRRHLRRGRAGSGPGPVLHRLCRRDQRGRSPGRLHHPLPGLALYLLHQYSHLRPGPGWAAGSWGRSRPRWPGTGGPSTFGGSLVLAVALGLLLLGLTRVREAGWSA